MLDEFARQIRIAGQRHVLSAFRPICQRLNNIAIRRRQRDVVAAIVQAERSGGGGDDCRAAELARWRSASEDHNGRAGRKGGLIRKDMLNAIGVG